MKGSSSHIVRDPQCIKSSFVAHTGQNKSRAEEQRQGQEEIFPLGLTVMEES